MSDFKLAYSGKLELTLKDRHGDIIFRETHNEGTSVMFKFLANSLVKKYNKSYAPSYIDVRNMDPDDGSFVSLLRSPVPLTANNLIYDEDDSNWKASFTGNILYTDFLTQPLFDDNTYLCVLDDSANKDIMAYAPLLDAETTDSQFVEGMELIVVWKMSINNIEE